MSDLNDDLKTDDLELDTLLRELAPTEEGRAWLLEEHRQLEKDLLRLADPLPPVDFVSKVMTRVAEAPARPLSTADVWSAALIVGVTLALAAVAFLASGGETGSFGLTVAALVLKLREGLVAFGSAIGALWSTAALPTAMGLSLMIVGALVVFRRLMPSAGKAVT